MKNEENNQLKYSEALPEMRTSTNNMLCYVPYEPLEEEEQKIIEELFRVAV